MSSEVHTRYWVQFELLVEGLQEGNESTFKISCPGYAHKVQGLSFSNPQIRRYRLPETP